PPAIRRGGIADAAGRRSLGPARRRPSRVGGASPVAGQPAAEHGQLRRPAVFRLGAVAGRRANRLRGDVLVPPERPLGPDLVAGLAGLLAGAFDVVNVGAMLMLGPFHSFS